MGNGRQRSGKGVGYRKKGEGIEIRKEREHMENRIRGYWIMGGYRRKE